jgi:hypothetical protein
MHRIVDKIGNDHGVDLRQLDRRIIGTFPWSEIVDYELNTVDGQTLPITNSDIGNRESL